MNRAPSAYPTRKGVYPVKWFELRRLAEASLSLVRRSRLPRAAAGLAYFLMLTVFPLLICLYHMLGSLFPTTQEIAALLEGVLPPETLDTLLSFLAYVSGKRSAFMFLMALTVLVTAAASAYRIIDDVLDELRRCRRDRTPGEYLASFLMSLLFLAAVYLAALLLLTGRWFLELLDRHLMFMNVSDAWAYLRFPLLALVIFALFAGVYRLTAPGGRPELRVLPGAAAGALALLTVSLAFALMLGESVRYPLVYGSLSSVILMMLWLYLCGMSLFLGAVLNAALEQCGPKKISIRGVANEKTIRLP